MRMAWASLFLAMAQVVFGSDCAALKSVSLENTTIKIAESVPAGHFKPPYGNEIDESAGVLPDSWRDQADQRFVHSV